MSAAAEKLRAPGKSRVRVLLVEDDAIDQRAFRRMVRDEALPYDCEFAGSVADAAHLLCERRFDVVITDYSLGDGTAFDVLERARDTPGVIVTGAGDEGIAVRGIKAGAFDYLVKDTTRNYLRALPGAIAAAIRHHQHERKARMLSHAMAAVSESVFITDEEGTVVFVNRGFCEMYGYAEDEVVGQHESVLARERRAGMSLGVFSELGVALHVTRAGRELTVAVSRSPVRDAHGHVIATVSIVRDVSERVRVEGALRAANAELERKRAVFEELSVRDELTGLYNRREFNRALAEQAGRGLHEGASVSLVLIDVDHFKRINDGHGHVAGDQVLRRLGQLVRAEVRSSDVCARFGGEEIAVLAPDTDAAGAHTLAERLRVAVTQCSFPFVRGDGSNDELAVTISVGVATVTAKMRTEDDLVIAADRALYEAKSKGRDRVVSAA